ncbi:RusA family crossover junction endodeoxyribonuclease [Rhodococcus ruber]|uniref:Uncharacterized protein n=1 Tax=Rhodococcus ruber TaxID=1830 RepID=A0A098BJU7_9NOCA|nr:RusA family crossover junction endodeoxyribonuclease [Rhodococcus ruber]MCZ4533371.1 RusA family crossover junction endodeoxyribonuclease [Rhodococcus ruber]MCZ4533378.1 RusA family crossover junction endodeoxyribonuclease [Rhodococcus ruber]CDZ88968.1 conserved hypothetical protein [Rhodococcus ruber]
MTYRITVDMPRPPLTSNDQRRAHWTKVRNAKAEAASQIITLVKRDGIPFMLDRVDVTVIWFAPDARRRDSDSLGPYCKAVLDALVEAGVLCDDDSRYVRQTAMRVDTDRTNPRIEILIEPIYQETA